MTDPYLETRDSLGNYSSLNGYLSLKDSLKDICVKLRRSYIYKDEEPEIVAHYSVSLMKKNVNEGKYRISFDTPCVPLREILAMAECGDKLVFFFERDSFYKLRLFDILPDGSRRKQTSRIGSSKNMIRLVITND